MTTEEVPTPQTEIPATTSPTPLVTATPFDVRDELTEIVLKDLLGPAGGNDEELSQYEDRATGRYLIGMLAPKATPVEAGDLDHLGTDGADDAEVGSTDAATPSKTTFFPNSMGMSFVVESAAKAILIQTHWGRYRRIKSTTQKTKAGTEASVWKREHFIGEDLAVPLKDGPIESLKPLPSVDEHVIIQGKIRSSPRGWVVTLFFVNNHPEKDRKKDEAWIFQPRMTVLDAAVPPQPIFIQRKDWEHDLSKMDPLTREETETLEMLYRNKLEFAVGHGVSVHVTKPENDPTHALMIATEFAPQSEVEQQTGPTVEDDPNLEGVVLDMKELAEMPKPALLASLHRLASA